MIAKVFDLVKFKEVSNGKLPRKEKIETYRLGPVPKPGEKKEKIQKPKVASTAETQSEDATAKGAKKHPAAKGKKAK